MFLPSSVCDSDSSGYANKIIIEKITIGKITFILNKRNTFKMYLSHKFAHVISNNSTNPILSSILPHSCRHKSIVQYNSKHHLSYHIVLGSYRLIKHLFNAEKTDSAIHLLHRFHLEAGKASDEVVCGISDIFARGVYSNHP